MKLSLRSHIILFAIGSLVIFNGCKTRQNVTNENFVNLYSEEDEKLASDISIQHIDAMQTRISLNINSGELLFVRESSAAPFYADIKISIVAFDYESGREVIDTASSVFKVAKDSISSDFLAYSVNLNINTGLHSFIRIDVEDLNKSRRETHTAVIDKRSEYASQWFGLMEQNDPHFTYYSYSPGDTVVLSYAGKDKDNLKVYFYKDSFEIPDPPFSFENLMPFKLDADSAFKPLSIDSKRLTFIVQEQGLYFISSHPDEKFGYTVLCTEEHYPLITKASDMVAPTRYICSKKEFNKMLENPNKKQAIDNFWLSIGDFEKRAGTLIKKYYSRVIQANRMFSSHTEGWKSDRGMIYFVFGLPNIVYRDTKNETWIYGEDKNFFSITFTFTRVENKFSDNDFFLIRTPIYKDNWYRAVDLWRQ